MRNLHSIFLSGSPVYILTVQYGFFFLHTLANTCYCLSFWYWSFWLVWSDTSLLFWFAFPWWLVLSASYEYFIFEKYLFSSTEFFFIFGNFVFESFWLSCMNYLYISSINPLLDVWFAEFSPIPLVAFLFCWLFLLLCWRI